MKKNLFLLTTMILCLTFTACGKKEAENTQTRQEAENQTVVEDTKTEEVSVTESESTIEEVIGDVDLPTTNITMADMQELVAGQDIIINEINEGTRDSFDGFKLLFPNSSFQTRDGVETKEADLEKIHFILSYTSRKENAPESVREERGHTLQTIGKYVVHFIPTCENGQYGLNYTYRIYDTESGNAIYVGIVINKKSDYQEYGDSLVEEFMPAFEEILFGNLQ